MYEPTLIEYTGTRRVPARTMIYHDGAIYNGQGYIFGGVRTFATMTQVEAQILTGAIPPVVDEASGKVITGFVIHLDLGKEGLTGETWRIVDAIEPTATPEPPAPTPTHEPPAPATETPT